MGRNSKIRITENDRREYERLVKNTKAKVRRTIKKYGPLINDVERSSDGSFQLKQFDIRERMKVPSLDSFSSRKEFNAWKEQQMLFTSGKSPHFKFTKNKFGMIGTDYLLTVMENTTYKANREAKKEQEKLKGKPYYPQAKQEMLKMKESDILGFAKFKFDFKEVYSPQNLMKKFEGGMAKRSPENIHRLKGIMKDNWMKVIEFNFHSLADDLISKIRGMSPEEFYDFYMMNKEEEGIEFRYMPSPQDYDGDVEFADGQEKLLYNIEHLVDTYRQKYGNSKNPLNHPNFE